MARRNRAIFLDRDGVLIEDVGLLVEETAVRLLPGVPAALRSLAEAGFELLVVSNQPVVARGMLTEDGVVALQREIAARLEAAGAPTLTGFYFCPHHPRANDPRYAVACDCRKPEPGLLLRAAAEHEIDLGRSFMIGDRPSDIAAGKAAGCRTVLVLTGRHLDAPIETSRPFDPSVEPDSTCSDLAAAAKWVLSSGLAAL